MIASDQERSKADDSEDSDGNKLSKKRRISSQDMEPSDAE